jgi:hypothetical protein
MPRELICQAFLIKLASKSTQSVVVSITCGLLIPDISVPSMAVAKWDTL